MTQHRRRDRAVRRRRPRAVRRLALDLLDQRAARGRDRRGHARLRAREPDRRGGPVRRARRRRSPRLSLGGPHLLADRVAQRPRRGRRSWWGSWRPSPSSLVERRTRHPMLPLELFASRTFSAANAMTLLVYAALGAVLFFLVIDVQTVLGYGALQAGHGHPADHRADAAAGLARRRARHPDRPADPDDGRPAGDGRGCGLAVLRRRRHVVLAGRAAAAVRLRARPRPHGRAPHRHGPGRGARPTAPASRAGSTTRSPGRGRSSRSPRCPSWSVCRGPSTTTRRRSAPPTARRCGCARVCWPRAASSRGSRSPARCRGSLRRRGRPGCRRPSWTARTEVAEGPRTTLSTMTRGRLGIASAATTSPRCSSRPAAPARRTRSPARRPGRSQPRPTRPTRPRRRTRRRRRRSTRPTRSRRPARSGRRCTPPTC